MSVFKTGDVEARAGSGYPAPYDKPCRGRHVRKLGDAGGLQQFGVSEITLAPGAWSSQRHYHTAEDELVYILSGHPTLVDDSGERRLSPGDVTTHRAGDPNAHHMINKTDAPVMYLVVGTRNPQADTAHYPDIDLHLPANGTPKRHYQRKDGTQY